MSLPLMLRLASEFDPIMPYVDEPEMSDFLQWAPRRCMGRQMMNRRAMQPGGQTAIGKDGFQVCMEVSQFKPNELSVKVVGDSVVVEGKHEERQDDHGFISRHFVRRYAMPKGYDPDKVKSTLSSDGVLTVSIPKPQIDSKTQGREIQIQQTGPAHLNVKENTQDTAAKSTNTPKK